MDNIVIIGAGHAGIQAAESLRKLGYGGALIMIGDEVHTPYQRPPLSKDFMVSQPQVPSALPLRGAQQLADLAIEMRLGIHAVAIDRQARSVTLSNDSVVAYDKLILATGASNRNLDIPGAQTIGVHGLRTLDDALALYRALPHARRAVVIGAGFIGLEFAAVAGKRGLDVTILEHASGPMARTLSPIMSAFFAQAHAKRGVRQHYGVTASALLASADGRIAAVIDTKHTHYPADLVLTGIGVQPRDELATAAGLETNNGIVVDRRLRTSDPHIFAIGDCANFPDLRRGCRSRLESVQNATDHARHVARVIMGEEKDYQAMPWFWSSQGDLRLQIAGITQAGDELVLRGTPASEQFSCFCFRQGQLAAVESVNQPAVHMAVRKRLSEGIALSPEQAADPGFDLKTLSDTEATGMA